jgi:hypothetical protein
MSSSQLREDCNNVTYLGMYPRQINKILDISCRYAVVGYCQNSNGGFDFKT